MGSLKSLGQGFLVATGIILDIQHSLTRHRRRRMAWLTLPTYPIYSSIKFNFSRAKKHQRQAD